MTRGSMSGKLKTLLIVAALATATAVVVAMIPFLDDEPVLVSSEPVIKHEEMHRQEKARFDRHMKEMRDRVEENLREAREADRRAALRVVVPLPPQPMRRVRRYAWESPAETRARLWNVPEVATKHAVITALVRMCTSEQVGSEPDCIGIWQVLRNVRNRTCDRERISRITECDDRGETMLSAMRRINRYALGAVPPKTARQRWISELQVDCKRPPSYPRGEKTWRRFHLKACQRTVRLATQLVEGRRRQRLTPVHIIAWGGRCEDAGGACDDPMACARGLARVRGLGTANAFWCKIHSPGCSGEVDPVCTQMGYRFGEDGRYTRSRNSTAVTTQDS